MTITGGDSALVTPPAESDGGRLGVRWPNTVQVCRTSGGVWQVLLPDGTRSTTCETLSAARRVARRWAQENPPSELIVRDAYHRVVLRRSFTDTQGHCVVVS